MFSVWAALPTFLLPPHIPTGSQTTASFGSLPHVALDTEDFKNYMLKELNNQQAKQCQ